MGGLWFRPKWCSLKAQVFNNRAIVRCGNEWLWMSLFCSHTGRQLGQLDEYKCWGRAEGHCFLIVYVDMWKCSHQYNTFILSPLHISWCFFVAGGVMKLIDVWDKTNFACLVQPDSFHFSPWSQSAINSRHSGLLLLVSVESQAPTEKTGNCAALKEAGLVVQFLGSLSRKPLFLHI